MFYSKTTKGFYDAAIHGDDIPPDAVDITLEEHTSLLEGQSAGLRIQADASGRPELLAAPPKTPAELEAEQSAAAKLALEKIDRDSIRSIREYIAAKPDAPQSLKNLEATAAGERVKLRI